MGEISPAPPPPGRRPPEPPPVNRPEQPPPPERKEGTSAVTTPPVAERKKVDAPQAAPATRPEPDHFGKPELPDPKGAADTAKVPPGTIFVDAEVRKVDPTTGKLETTKQVHEVIEPKVTRESWLSEMFTEARKESMNARDDAETRADIEKKERHDAAWHDSAQHIGDGQAGDDGAAGATWGAIFSNWKFEGVDPNAGDYLAGARAVGQAVAGAVGRNQAARTDVPGKMNAAPDEPGAEKIPPGMSRNEMKETLSRDRDFPGALEPNVKQPGVDLVGGKPGETWSQRVDPKTGQVEVDHKVEGGEWIQLKRLESVDQAKTTLGERIDKAVDLSFEKFDKPLQAGRSVRSAELSDGTRFTEDLRSPDTLRISIEVEGFDRLNPADQQAAQLRAQDKVDGYLGNWGAPPGTFMGKPVHVKVVPAP